MLTLLLFAFLSGIVTVLSPCILPILPLLLSAGIGKGAYRPYGVIIGLICSFTFFTLSLTALVQATGISPDLLRYISLGLIIFFGLTLLFPSFALFFDTITAPLVRLGNRLQGTGNTEGGFISGLILGSALGLVWAPCAGPILATITTLVATGSVTANTIIITLAYSCGTALPMFLFIHGGNALVQSISNITPYTQIIRQIFGALMIIGALAIGFHFDVVLQQMAVRYFPVIAIEDNDLVKKELKLLQGKNKMKMFESSPSIGSAAPDFAGIADWINTKPLTIEELKGHVVLVDFWTYSCINCVRTLPHITKWYNTYKDDGFIIVGVHTPEFEFEKSRANVQAAIDRFGITYPVALDNNYGTWRAYDNHYWPAHFLIDQNGIIQYTHFGEGEYGKTENMIRTLLNHPPKAEITPHEMATKQTPELYLGYQRAEHYADGIQLQSNRVAEYSFATLETDQVGLSGQWLVNAECITSKGNPSTLELDFTAYRVYLVICSENESEITVLLDDQSLPQECYTKDMNQAGKVIVKESRMYEMLHLKDDGKRHKLTLKVPENVSLYAFTFGSKEG
jgi:cytochrome c biogenesis protein CcdA/thiol-disulfide isomerase/thioredoxin